MSAAPLRADPDVIGRPGVARRVVVGVALSCSALTSPALELTAGERAADGAPAADPAAVEQHGAPAADPAAVEHDGAPAADRAAVEQAGVARAAPPAPAAADVPSTATAPTLDPQWKEQLSGEYVIQDAGCAVDTTSAEGLDAFFARPVGTVHGFDEPRTYALGDGRTLWVLQDAFTDETGRATSFAHMGYANSMVLIQEGDCFTSLRRGTVEHAVAFEHGTGDITFDRYFWPAGGAVSDGVLQMFWMEMVRDQMEIGPLDGIALHPVATWLATYDVTTMQRLTFAPAPNPGVAPVYGYHVAQQDGWAYLFGNSFLQNLALEGGVEHGPHSATRNYLARVPAGRLDTAPAYWDGVGWSDDPAAAVPISSRHWIENLMLPVPLDGRWVSATKTDGFLGSTVTVDVAPDPWGPWTTVATVPAVPRGDPTDVVTYHATVLSHLDPSGRAIICLSQVPMELGATDAPPRYRPRFFTVDLG